MVRQILNALGMLVVLTVICGIIYPLVMTGLAQTIFPYQANGSVINRDGNLVGSHLIGQSFTSAGYFNGRPSSAGDKGYDATNSGGSNLGPTNKKLMDTVADNVKQVREDNGLGQDYGIPADLVLGSASGLDPDISPAAAYIQVERVAKARNLDIVAVQQLVTQQIKGKQWGLFGEARVNVLELNLALDELK